MPEYMISSIQVAQLESMSQIDTKIEKYLAIRLGSLPVTALIVRQMVPQVGKAGQSLTLELLRGEQTVTLTFSGLRELRIAHLHPGSVCLMNISFIAHDQMEDLRYRVFNEEQDLTLAFYCADFEVSA
jgi:hypothetical protein